jgi:hypothetical protein
MYVPMYVPIGTIADANDYSFIDSLITCASLEEQTHMESCSDVEAGAFYCYGTLYLSIYLSMCSQVFIYLSMYLSIYLSLGDDTYYAQASVCIAVFYNNGLPGSISLHMHLCI